MKKINKFVLPIVTVSVLLSSCAQPDPTNLALTKLLENVSKVDQLPKINKGVVSGSVLENFKGEKPEIILKIIRSEDIFDLDANGKRKKGADGKELTIEKKGQVLQTIKLKDKYSFVSDSFLPGAVSIQANKKPENIEASATVEIGKVSLVQPLIFGVLGNNNVLKPPTVINISGKIVNPDGTPAVGAKVADVTGGFVSISTITDSNGAFTLSEAPFTKPRSIEVSQGNVDTPEGRFASYSVLPDETENITIPLVSNARFISGRIFNSVLKTTNIEGLNIKVDGTNISTNTDKEGKFRLKGVSLSQVNLSIGGIKGYIDRIITVSPSQVNEDRNLGDLFVTPLGGVRVNLAAESSPMYRTLDNGKIVSSGFAGLGIVTFSPLRDVQILQKNFYRPYNDSVPNANLTMQSPTAGSTTSFYCGRIGVYDSASTVDLPQSSDVFRPFATYVLLNSGGSIPNCEYVNNVVYKKSLQGVIQFEGTDIKVPFTYPPTPTRDVTIFSGFDKKTLSVDAANERLSVPIEDVPGGEYTVSIAMDHHETQKGLRLVIPSNDITSTELIQMRIAKAVSSVGDIRGKVIIKDLAGNTQPLPAGTRVAVVSAFDEVITQQRLEKIFNPGLSEQDAIQNQETYGRATVNPDGTYTLNNIPSGTRIIVAAVFNASGGLDTSLIPNTYVLVNVVSGLSTFASDMVLIKR